MRKYLSIVQLFFRAQLVYRFDVLMGLMELAARIGSAFIIWGAIYEGRDMVDGYAFHEMVSYYIAGAFIAGLDSSSDVCSALASGIRDGGFSKQMVLPVAPQGYFCARTLGKAAYGGIFAFIVLACVGIYAKTSLAALMLALGMITLGLVCMACYYFLIGLMAFKFNDVGFFMYIQWTVREFMTGSLVPLFLLPAGVLDIFALLPFTHVVYTPVMLIIGRMEIGEGVLCLGTLALWTLGLWLANERIYQKYRVKYDGVGI